MKRSLSLFLHPGRTVTLLFSERPRATATRTARIPAAVAKIASPKAHVAIAKRNLSTAASSSSSSFVEAEIPPLLDACTSKNDKTYLNQASLGLQSPRTVSAMQSFIQDVAQHGNTYMTDQDEADYLSSLRYQTARLLGCHNQEQIAIVSGASEILGQLPHLLLPSPHNLQGKSSEDTTVLLIDGDFPAITRPWMLAASQSQCRIKFVPNTDSSLDLTDSLCEAIYDSNSNIRVVAVSYVQFATGCRIDPMRLREATDAVGAKLVLDVTQAAGAVPLSFDTWQPDVMITSGYKWLGGHGGVALAAVSPTLAKESVPLLPGWMGVPDPFDLPAQTSRNLNEFWAADARRYTQSTMSYVSVAALTASLQELDDLGIDRIEVHAKALAQKLVQDLQGTGWGPFRPLSTPCASSHIVSLSYNRAADSNLDMKEGTARSNHIIDMDALVRHLRQANIVCGSRSGRLRISLAAFNSGEDVRRLAEQLVLYTTAD